MDRGTQNALREIMVATNRTKGDKVFWKHYIKNFILFCILLNFIIAEF